MSGTGEERDDETHEERLDRLAHEEVQSWPQVTAAGKAELARLLRPAVDRTTRSD